MKKSFFTILLCFILVFSFSVNSFAYSIYDNNSANARAIDSWNDMTFSEQKEYLPNLMPIVLSKLGLKRGNVTYDMVNNRYLANLSILKGVNPNPEYWTSGNHYLTYKPELYAYVNSDTGVSLFYDSFADFFAHHLSSQDSLLEIDKTGSDAVVSIVNNIVEEYVGTQGVVERSIYSYRNLSSSAFRNNGTLVNNFYSLVSNNRDARFIIVTSSLGYSYGQPNYDYFVGIPKVRPANIYINGSTGTELETNILFCSSSGVNLTYEDFDWYHSTVNGSTFVSTSGPPFTTIAGCSNTATIPFNNNNGQQISKGFAVLNTNDSETRYTLFTSLTGFINNNGQFVNAYSFYPYWGNVPSVTVSPSDLSNYFNATFSPSNENNNNINIVFPDNYQNYNDNNYDSEHKILSFDGISNLLSSLGSLIGSLINGIAQGIANILNSIVSVVTNFFNLFLNEDAVFISFFAAFFAWLPEPLPQLIIGLFTVAILFSLIKLIKGVF